MPNVTLDPDAFVRSLLNHGCLPIAEDILQAIQAAVREAFPAPTIVRVPADEKVHVGAPMTPYKTGCALTEAELDLCQKGEKLQAIKALRNRTGWGLQECNALCSLWVEKFAPKKVK